MQKEARNKHKGAIIGHKMNLTEIKEYIVGNVDPPPTPDETEIIAQGMLSIQKNEGLALDRSLSCAIEEFYRNKKLKRPQRVTWGPKAPNHSMGFIDEPTTQVVKKAPTGEEPTDLKVVTSNALIDSRYNLTLNEMKTILYMLTKIYRDDDDFKEYRFAISDFKELLVTGQSRIYTAMKKITEQLLSKPLTILEEDGNLLQCNFISSALYHANQGYVDFSFDPKLKPHLLRLKKRFTAFSILPLLGCESTYTIRLYEMLRSFSGLGGRTISIEDLKVMLKLDKQYTEYFNFRKRVLDVAIEEISEKTDLKVTYIEIKKGKTPVAIKFKIAEQSQALKLTGA